MMRSKLVIMAAAITVAMTCCVTARAEILAFTDTNKYWPGRNNGTSDDKYDTIGVPNFSEGTATVSSAVLTNLTFKRTGGTDSIISPGDLFIDLGADQVWDYVVDITSWTEAGKTNPDPAAGYYNIYRISIALGDTGGSYILSGNDGVDGWSGRSMRDRHPVAANMADIEAALYGQAYFSGWGGSSTTQYSFDFPGLNLGNSGEFIIGWQPNCANDVIYEKLSYCGTPEPGSMGLVLLGVAGMARCLRKKLIK